MTRIQKILDEVGAIAFPVIVDADGTTLGKEDRLMAFSQFNDLIGVEEKFALAKRFGKA